MSLRKPIVASELVKIWFMICVILLRLPKYTSMPAANMYSDKVQNYLMEFGYLPKSNIETGNLRSEEQLKESIKQLQTFANIPATGLIDEKTIELMKKPRCGQPDNRNSPDFFSTNRVKRRHRRYVIQGPKWPTTSITWSLVNQTMADLDVGKVRRILRDALDVWSRGSRLTFQEVYSKDADIQVLFARRHHGDGYDFDGPGSVLAHAFYPGTGRGGDAHFDEEEKWTLSATENDGTNLMGVAVHEFGHSIGLGHSSVESALMFPWYHGYQKFKELPEDDRLAIQQIYGSRGKIWGDITTTSTTTTTARSYYPERDPQREERRRQQEWDERKRQQAEWEKKEQERWQRTQREREKQEQERKAKEREIERRKNGVRPNYQPSTTVSTPKKTWKPYHNHNHNHHSKFNKNTSNPKEKKPETCNTSYDAISIIRGELFIFKDRYLWRIGKDGLLPGYPHEIDKLWKGLPKNFTHIDTVYENKYGKIIFFIGKMYYVFDASTLVDGYPKALTTLGLPASLDKIDAALVWGHNNRTYFYSGTMYWRFDEDIDHVELDYPRDMSIWRGIGYNIDSAFQYKDGKTYFFKDKSYWQFDDSTMRVARWKSELSAQRWMKCPRVTATYSNEVYDDEDDEERREPLTASAIIIMNSAITLPLFTIIVLCINVNF